MDLRAVIFVPALVGCVLFGFVFALFAARSYLNVLQGTGAGAKRIPWNSGPILDSFGEVFYLAWLIGIWLIPAWFVSRAFGSGSGLLWVRYAVPLSVFWICYPVSQMSSLSGPSIWLPLHPDVFGRLARKLRLVLGFLGLSGGVLALLGLGFHWTFVADGMVTLFAGSLLFVVAGLFYARLLGRVGFALMFTRSLFARRKKRKRREEAAESSANESGPEAESAVSNASDDELGFVQPSELPPIHTPDEGPVHGYNINFADEPPKKKRVRAVAVKEAPKESASAEPATIESPRGSNADDDDLMSYVVREPEVEPEAAAPKEVIQPSEFEMQLLNRDDAPKPPKHVWNGDVFTFLFQPDSLAVVGLLTLLCFFAGGMVRIAREFNPVAGE